ncbi:mitotic spindle checkpoint protein Bub3, partial [Mycoemilia scoparia]
MVSEKEFELSNGPTDGVSCTIFHPTDPNLLLVTSWDGKVRLYDVLENSLKNSHAEHEGAVLSGTFSAQDGVAFSGGLDGRVVIWYDAYTKTKSIGSHKKAVSCMDFNSEYQYLVTGSWDKSVCIWDAKALGQTQQEQSQETKPLQTLSQEERVYSLSTIGHHLVVALADRKFVIYDLRDIAELAKPEDNIEPRWSRMSTLKYQTRRIQCMPSGNGFVAGSIEGRVAVEYIDDSPEVQSKKYAFRCHRKQVDGVENIYPVNAISFHPVHHTFATGGEDGTVCLWDGFNKKRIKLYPEYPTSVSALSFNCNGKLLAIASSYTYAQGVR